MHISTPLLVMIIVLIVFIALMVVFYFLGKRLQKRQQEQDEIVQNAAQPMSMLVIDKQRMRITKAGLPEAIVAQTPWYAKRSRVPVVKAKVGPQVVTLLCDPDVFKELPTKKEIRAMVSGLYISGFKSLHGKTVTKPQKKGFIYRMKKLAGM